MFHDIDPLITPTPDKFNSAYEDPTRTIFPLEDEELGKVRSTHRLLDQVIHLPLTGQQEELIDMLLRDIRGNPRPVEISGVKQVKETRSIQILPRTFNEARNRIGEVIYDQYAVLRPRLWLGDQVLEVYNGCEVDSPSNQFLRLAVDMGWVEQKEILVKYDLEEYLSLLRSSDVVSYSYTFVACPSWFLKFFNSSMHTYS